MKFDLSQLGQQRSTNLHGKHTQRARGSESEWVRELVDELKEKHTITIPVTFRDARKTNNLDNKWGTMCKQTTWEGYPSFGTFRFTFRHTASESGREKVVNLIYLRFA